MGRSGWGRITANVTVKTVDCSAGACAGSRRRSVGTHVTDTEVSAIDSLTSGTGVWKVGQRSFVVQRTISEAERWFVHTEP